MPKEAPTEDGHWTMRPFKRAMGQLGETEQGILVLHHAIVAHIEWPLWNEVTGIPDRTITPHFSETVPVDVADPEHPITRGLEAWSQADETYEMNSAEETDGNHTCLPQTTPEACGRSPGRASTAQSRVFCLQLGHDNAAYTHPSFRTVLHRGIQWCAGEL